MGRRKIEIQPITHERNRSVTFLKRKNGLFKKAYELGVLCSVDVAVIIFEERPGHHVKLYQYCSTDVQGMVQRHLRFDGEKDTRTPVDFSNNKNPPAEEDEEDDDEDGAAGHHNKKDAKGPLKPKDASHMNGNGHHTNGTMNVGGVPIRPAQPTDVSQHGIDMDYRSANGRLSTAPTSTATTGAGAGAQTNGMHGDRRNARQPPGHLNLGALNLNNGLGGLGLPLPVPVPLPPNKRQRLEDLAPPGLAYPYRLDVDLGTYPPTAMATSLPQAGARDQGGQGQQGLSGLFGAQGGYMQQQQQQQGFEYSRRGSMVYGQQQQQQSQQQQQQSQYGGSMFGSRAAGPTSTNMLVDLLNASNEAAQGGGAFSGFDWPVTSAQQGGSEVPNNNDPTSWLDFLTSNTAAAPGGSSHTPTMSGVTIGLPTPTASRAASGSVSSVSSAGGPTGRGQGPYGMPSAASSAESVRLSSANGMRMSPSRKRTRDEANELDDPLVGAELGRMGLGGKIALGVEDGDRRSLG